MGDSQPSHAERRRNHELRQLLDELMTVARTLTRKHSLMTQEELASAGERIGWLAEEIYRAAIEPGTLLPDRR
ncbi:MAG: hypothetical protein HY704_15975 [Gemmatimonadetes bacterium]|nr:hypothetical protein [Gemmatimonadota bacterium]